MLKKLNICILLMAKIYAGTVDSRFFYQDYLDFGANLGRFSAGSQNVTITSIDGNKSITLEVMPDFSFANTSGKLLGEFSNIGGNYIITASHMLDPKNGVSKGSILEFGGVKTSVADSANNFASYFDGDNPIRDFEVLRMDKINLNASAKLINNHFFEKVDSDVQGYAYKENLKEILDNPRYSLFVRSGSGVQGINIYDKSVGPYDSANDPIADANQYRTGGILYNATELKRKNTKGTITGEIKFFATEENSTNYKEFAISGGAGDSGSALLVYDNIDKTYYVLGVASSVGDVGQHACGGGYSTYKCWTTVYAPINNLYLQDYQESHTLRLSDSTYEIRDNKLYSADLEVYTLTQDAKKDKDFVFGGNGTLILKQETNLNTSALYFAENSTFSIKADIDSKTQQPYSLLSAGVVVNSNAILEMDARTASGDVLVKMGEGRLKILQSSADARFRIGEGEVEFLNEGLAFGSIYAINGAKISIHHTGQINPDRIYFGRNGAILELNGNDLTFNTLNASDDGAIIHNSSDQISSINLNGDNHTHIFHGNFIGNIDLAINANYIFDGSLKIKNLSISKDVFFQAHPIVHNYIDKDIKFNNSSSNVVVNSYDALINQYNQSPLFSQPTMASSEANDVEARIFSFDKVILNGATLTQSSNTTISADTITSTNGGKIILGDSKMWLDSNDGNNVISSNSSSIDGEFIYQETLSQANIENRNILMQANVVLQDISNITINQAILRGNIAGEINSTATLQNAEVYGNIRVGNLEANNSSFYISLNPNDPTISIQALQSASGGNNHIEITVNKTRKIKTNDVIIASLQETNEIHQDYFSFSSKNDPAITDQILFRKYNGAYQWYLEGADIPLMDIYSGENLNTANLGADAIYYSYITEWNNLNKRMGELRGENNKAGVWARVYGGHTTADNGSSSLKSNYYQIQVGSDYHTSLKGVNLFSGALFSYTRFLLGNGGISGTMDSLGGGIYTSAIFDSGIYIDAIIKYLHYQNDYKVSLQNSTFSTNASTPVILGSVELGYRGWVTNNYYLEPFIGLIAGYIGKQSLKDELGGKITAKGSVPLHLKMGIFTGYKKGFFTIRGGFGSATDLAHSREKILSDENILYHQQTKRDSRLFVNISANLAFSSATRLAFEFERTFYGQFNIDYSVNMVFRQGF
ncbi:MULTISPECIES: autotransporter outer membrane beta-barrel domain-containing protein [unclassified Helicobacter]|uniref:autotransporter outer membrane beta-barrel domain-containing protein n=1 Tax=unclassified Helicobacter TaxID=2593540 RepID=UPI000CF06CF0|nr:MULTISPECIES: autotransporter outer membrane beta-barrel domain-containing protein [unclassified Helicobacter]